jgi:hypothetical protein
MGSLSMTLVSIVAVGVLYVMVPVVIDTYFRFRDKRTVHCPESGLAAKVQADAWHAAATAIPGPPRVHLVGCSLWPEHEHCGQECVTGRQKEEPAPASA